jgi:hypothetical protein
MGFFQQVLKTKRSSDVDEVKQILRESSGARDFLLRSLLAGFIIEEESAFGLLMARRSCRVIFNQQRDKIGTLTMKEAGKEEVCLVESGESKF